MVSAHIFGVDQLVGWRPLFIFVFPSPSSSCAAFCTSLVVRLLSESEAVFASCQSLVDVCVRVLSITPM